MIKNRVRCFADSNSAYGALICMNIVITGSTTWHNKERIAEVLREFPSTTHIITGDTAGVDEHAALVASELGLKCTRMKKIKEDYAKFPQAAWKGLNERMLALDIHLVLAFHPEFGMDGYARGTVHAVDLAKQRGIKVIVIRS